MLQKGIEFYIKKPLDDNYFLCTIKNVSRLISANRCISALTGLPGNVQIENELKRMKEFESPEVDGEIIVQGAAGSAVVGEFINARILEASEYDLIAERIL